MAERNAAVAATDEGRRRPGRKHQEIDILHGSLWTNILRFATPVALTSILEQLSNMIDTVMIGRLMGEHGTMGMAAVGSNTPISSFIIGLFVGVSLGSNVVIANAIGRRDHDAVERAVHTSIVMSLAGFFVIALGELIAEPLLNALSVPADTLPEALSFLRVYLLAMPFILLYNFEAAILRSVGETKLPLQALIVSAVLNVALDLLFIGFLGWGVIGSAIATDLCYVSSATMLFIRLLHDKGEVRVTPSKLRLDAPSMKRIVRIGLPAGAQSAVFAVANIVIQSAINRLGTEMMAASSAAVSIEYVVYCLLSSFGQATTTFVGQNSGAGQIRRCKETLRVSLIEGLVVDILLIGGVMLFGRAVLAIFNGDPEIIEMGYVRLCYIVPAYLFSMAYENMSGYMRGFGISLAPAVVTTVVICGLRFFWVGIVFPANPTFYTVMAIYPISLGINCACILALLLFVRPARTALEHRQERRVA